MSTQAAATSTTGRNTLYLGIGLLGWLLLSYLPSLAAVSIPIGDWYVSLNKPEWNPPNWIFGPVWMTLYTLMGVSAWRVWCKGGWREQAFPLSMFIVQLILNGLWTPLFFGLHLLGAALAEILLMWIAIAWTIKSFVRVDRVAASLLVPYLAWVSFAAFLNWTIWSMNG